MRKYRSVLPSALIGIGLLFTTGYFLFSALEGRYGWFAFSDTNQRISQMRAKERRIDHEIHRIQKKIAGLTGPDLSFDLLDEKIRENLGYLRSDEVILYDEGIPDPESFSYLDGNLSY